MTELTFLQQTVQRAEELASDNSFLKSAGVLPWDAESTLDTKEDELNAGR